MLRNYRRRLVPLFAVLVATAASCAGQEQEPFGGFTHWTEDYIDHADGNLPGHNDLLKIEWADAMVWYPNSTERSIVAGIIFRDLSGLPKENDSVVDRIPRNVVAIGFDVGCGPPDSDEHFVGVSVTMYADAMHAQSVAPAGLPPVDRFSVARAGNSLFVAVPLDQLCVHRDRYAEEPQIHTRIEGLAISDCMGLCDPNHNEYERWLDDPAPGIYDLNGTLIEPEEELEETDPAVPPPEPVEEPVQEQPANNETAPVLDTPPEQGEETPHIGVVAVLAATLLVCRMRRQR